MAHNITERDNLFTVREPAWHGLGQVLPDHPTREEAKSIAHPWEPVTETLYRAVPEVEETYVHGPSGPGTVMTPTVRYEEVEDFVGVARSDDGEMLGVVSDTFQIVSNEEMYDIAEAIEGEAKGSVMYETGGSLKGGRKVWLLIRLRDPLVIGKRHATEVIPYYALQNAHDGSGAFRGQATMTAIVCDNTSQMADLDARARGTEFVFRHTKNVGQRIEEAKIALAGWRESVEAFEQIADYLVQQRIDSHQRQLFVEEFIPMPQTTLVSERVRYNVEQGREKMYKIFDSPTQESIRDTAYGLVQASVEYHQHYRRAKSKESHFQRAYLDRSRFTQVAVDLAKEVVRA